MSDLTFEPVTEPGREVNQPTIWWKLMQVQLELHVPKNMYNEFGKFKFRNAETILETVKPIAARYGCMVKCDSIAFSCGSREHCETVAMFIDVETGSSVEARASVPVCSVKKGMDDSQMGGCAISYSKKYALCNLFAIDDSSEDPDDARNYPQGMAQAPVQESVDALVQEYLQALDAYCYRAQKDFDDVLGRQLAFFKVASIDKLSAGQLRNLIDKCESAGH
ncbi:MAG: ERF family protein [Eggerthellaceae bacterium]|nr:ERF family protein [Eggerthellaceae bacterium]